MQIVSCCRVETRRSCVWVARGQLKLMRMSLVYYWRMLWLTEIGTTEVCYYNKLIQKTSALEDFLQKWYREDGDTQRHKRNELLQTNLKQNIPLISFMTSQTNVIFCETHYQKSRGMQLSISLSFWTFCLR